MKYVKYLFCLLICFIFLVGCNELTYEYNGEEDIYALKGNEMDDINANGAKVVVKEEQAFVEFTSEGDYNTYSKGEHKIKKKDKFYKYYFVNLEQVTGKTYGTDETIKLKDKTYGDLELNMSGSYDYEIYDIRSFVASYFKLDEDEVVSFDEYAEYAIVQVVVEEAVKLNVPFKEMDSYKDGIVLDAIKELKEIGINCTNLKVERIDLNADSYARVDAYDKTQVLYNTLIKGNTWFAKDGSELQFSDLRFNWYQKAGDYDGNIQYGDYEFYSGKLAVEFVAVDLKSFGVTQYELEKLFSTSDIYKEDNFVAFNINLEGYNIDGKNTTINQPVYWYGFFLNNNTILQVVNMKTGSYYTFTKRKI